MYRVAVVALVGLAVSGCSLGSPKLFSFGFTDNAAYSPSPQGPALGIGSATTPPKARTNGSQRLASLDDKAPAGKFAKAPRGALEDRNYSQTQLNAERARDLLNAYRRKNGLKPVTLNALLTAAAKAHSRDLAKWDRISHYGSDGSNPWDRVKRAGYAARVAAENVGTGQASLEEVFKGWKNSPGHNKNLLMRDVKHMGIALVQDPRTEFKTFWTLVLGASS